MKLIFMLSVSTSFSQVSETNIEKFKKAIGPSKYIRVIHFNEDEGESIDSIYSEYVEGGHVLDSNSETFQKIKSANPRIRDLQKIKAKTALYLFIPLENISFQALMDNKPKLYKRLKILMQKNPDLRGYNPLKSSIFYMASYGNFTESNVERADVDFYQNSPATLGYSMGYQKQNSPWSYSGSVYVSTLVAAVSNIDEEEFLVNPEVGMNGYIEHSVFSPKIKAYGGLDLEQFNSVNLQALQEDSKLRADENTMLFLTFGFSSLLTFWNQKIFTKFSLSQSIYSQKKNANNYDDMEESFSGQKAMLYVNYALNKKWFLHSLYKLHKLKSDSDLSSQRLGVGFGYSLD